MDRADTSNTGVLVVDRAEWTELALRPRLEAQVALDCEVALGNITFLKLFVMATCSSWGGGGGGFLYFSGGGSPKRVFFSWDLEKLFLFLSNFNIGAIPRTFF